MADANGIDRIAQLEAELAKTKLELAQAQVTPVLPPQPELTVDTYQPEPLWYQAVRNQVSIKNAPDPEATDVGTLQKGQQLQVLPRLVKGIDGREWVQLTVKYVNVSCKDHSGPGYVLIDGSHLDMGLQLVGPLQNEESKQGEDLSEPWYEAQQGTVLIKEKPDKDSKSVGMIRQGNKIQVQAGAIVTYNDGRWVALNQKTLQRVCERPTAQGYALIDGTHLGVGVLLKGPLPEIADGEADEIHRAEAQVAFEMRQHQVAAAQEKAFKRQEERQAEQRRRQRDEQGLKVAEFLERAKKEGDRHQEVDKYMRSKFNAYRALHDHFYVKRSTSSDPESARIDRVACKPGALLFTNDTEWTDSTGGLWKPKIAKENGRAIGWVLIQGPGFAINGPFLVKENSNGYVQCNVCYLANLGDFLIYDGFCEENSKLRTLKNSVAKATGLNAKALMILKGGKSDAKGGKAPIQSKDLLNDDKTFAELNFQGRVVLHVLYMDDFLQDFHGFPPEFEL